MDMFLDWNRRGYLSSEVQVRSHAMYILRCNMNELKNSLSHCYNFVLTDEESETIWESYFRETTAESISLMGWV